MVVYNDSHEVIKVIITSLFWGKNPGLIINYVNSCYSTQDLVYSYVNILLAFHYPISEWGALHVCIVLANG